MLFPIISDNDKLLVGDNPTMEPGEYNILTNHDTGARPKKVSFSFLIIPKIIFWEYITATF